MPEEQRKLRVGDRVRIRDGSWMMANYNIQPEDLGTVIAVESEPHETGPTCRVEVKFDCQTESLPWTWGSNFVLASTEP